MGERIAVKTIMALESPKRVLRIDQTALMDCKRFYRYMREDERLLLFAMGHMGTYSDVFILYAVAVMGVATPQSISDFLRALSGQYPDLSIVHEKSKDLDERIRSLYKSGLLFVFRYDLDAVGDVGKVKKQTVSLYTATDSCVNLVNQRLQKRVSLNNQIQYKPVEEMIGWAAAANIGTYIANSPHFVEFLERVLRTKHLGTVYFPIELKTVVDNRSYYIAVIDSYLYKNSYIQSEIDFKERKVFKINFIKEYLYMRTQKGTAIVVITVCDKEDLMEMANMIYTLPVFKEVLSQIYFTGEGLIREYGSYHPEECFIQIKEDSVSEHGFHLETIKPIFM